MAQAPYTGDGSQCDPYVVSFGTEDPSTNPKRWSAGRKWTILLVCKQQASDVSLLVGSMLMLHLPDSFGMMSVRRGRRLDALAVIDTVIY